MEDDITELANQITQTFGRSLDQPNFNYQLNFYYHFEKHMMMVIMTEKIIIFEYESNTLKPN